MAAQRSRVGARMRTVRAEAGRYPSRRGKPRSAAGGLHPPHHAVRSRRHRRAGGRRATGPRIPRRPVCGARPPRHDGRSAEPRRRREAGGDRRVRPRVHRARSAADRRRRHEQHRGDDGRSRGAPGHRRRDCRDVRGAVLRPPEPGRHRRPLPRDRAPRHRCRWSSTTSRHEPVGSSRPTMSSSSRAPRTSSG